MVETIVSGLFLAAISGLSFVAYKHPAAFGKLFVPIVIILFTIVGVIVIWDFSLSRAFTHFLPYFERDKLDLASEAHDNLSKAPWTGTAY